MKRYASFSDKDRPPRLKAALELRQAGRRGSRLAALHLDPDRVRPSTENEVHLVDSVPPILDHGALCGAVIVIAIDLLLYFMLCNVTFCC